MEKEKENTKNDETALLAAWHVKCRFITSIVRFANNKQRKIVKQSSFCCQRFPNHKILRDNVGLFFTHHFKKGRLFYFKFSDVKYLFPQFLQNPKSNILTFCSFSQKLAKSIIFRKFEKADFSYLLAVETCWLVLRI